MNYFLSFFIVWGFFSPDLGAIDCHKSQLPLSYKQNPHTKVFKLDSNVVGFVGEMTIDVDGSPQAYNPQDTGLDALCSAGCAGHLSPDVIVFVKGKPYIQKSADPFPGYYLASTALTDGRFHDTDFRRYVNAEKIPYISVPPNMLKYVRKGDIVFVHNKKTNKNAFAIVADVGNNLHIGEGSVALADSLGVKILYKKTKHQISGCDAINGTVAYIIFKNTGTGKPLTVEEIAERASAIPQNTIDEYVNCLFK